MSIKHVSMGEKNCIFLNNTTKSSRKSVALAYILQISLISSIIGDSRIPIPSSTFSLLQYRMENSTMYS